MGHGCCSILLPFNRELCTFYFPIFVSFTKYSRQLLSVQKRACTYCTGVYGSNTRGRVMLANFETLATKAKLCVTDANLGNLS
jgi:hypothetical protein